jgi:DNA-binding MarR family transcriptional regulator
MISTTPSRQTAPSRHSAAELAATLRPSLLRLTRILRNQRADMSVSLTQLSAMGTLYKKGPMSAGDLAAFERVQPPSMTKVLASLEEKKLVTREPHPSDKRQVIITLTEAGSELLESERQQRHAWLSQRLAQLTPEERATLRDVIPVLDKLAEL